MPPSGFSRKAVVGALQFIEACYRDLLEEVRAGKHENLEEAIEFELSNLERALAKIHVNQNGDLTEK